MEAAEVRSYCPLCNAVFRTPFARCPLDGTKLAELDDDPLVGTVLDKRYVIEECIGEGGMGRVYRAKHTRMSRHYAIKILFGDHAGDTRMRSRFAREAEAVSRLSHVNVISVLDFGETEEGLLYLVMDLAAGESLSELVHREAPLNPSRAIEILARLSKGLAHAHNHGLVHRDFKCENVIMVTEEGVEVPKIVDFGICMIVEDAPASTMLTSNGMIMGTPAVMAPEQASGDKVDHRTDLFSLGIVGFQMISGCLPFEGTPLEMARKNLYEPIPSILDRSGIHVDPALEAVISRLTAKKPDDRFQNAQEVFEALRALGSSNSFDSWTNVTPIPGGAPSASQPNMAAYDSSGGFDATEAVSPLHIDSNPYLGGQALRSRRNNSRILLAAAGGAILLGVIIALAVSGDSTDLENDPAALAASDVTALDGGLALEVPPDGSDTEGLLNTTDPDETSLTATERDAGASQMVFVLQADASTGAANTTEIDKDKPTEEMDKKEARRLRKVKNAQKAAERNAARARAKAKAKAAKDKELRTSQGRSQMELKRQQTATLKLYGDTAASLSKLEKTHSKNVAKNFRKRFNGVNRTKIRTSIDYALAAKPKLRLLQNQIIQRQRRR